MSCEPAAKRARVESSPVPAADVIQLHLLLPKASESEETSLAFRPDMTHQLFGDDEEIKGHVDPAAAVFISAASFESFVEFCSKARGPGATEVKKILVETFKKGLLPSRTSLGEAHAKAQGLQIPATETSLAQLGSGEGEVLVYHYKLCDAPEPVKAIHDRAQQLLTFFVDGATPLDQSEEGWELLIAVRKVEGVQILVGFCTIYRLYAYPCSYRLRVSQILVLPPFQKQGIGRMLLEAVYKMADSEELHDIIYEEPTDQVEALREKIELKRAQALPWLVDLASRQSDISLAMNGAAGAHPPTTLALPSQFVSRAQKELRVPKQQVRRLWESLLVQRAPFQHEPGVLSLRGLVARRLFGGFADTKEQATGKQIFQLDDLGSFCMHKVPRAAGIRGLPVAIEDRETGPSREEREAALEEAVDSRMAVLLKTKT